MRHETTSLGQIVTVTTKPTISDKHSVNTPTRGIRELKQLRRRPQRRLQKAIGLMIKKTTALHVHHAFWYISLTSTARLRRETSYFDVLWRTWTYGDEFFFILFNLNIILKNLTPGKVACSWHIELVQIDTIKFERTQTHFFTDVFSGRRRRPCLKIQTGDMCILSM